MDENTRLYQQDMAAKMMPYMNANSQDQIALTELSNPEADIYRLELSLKGKILDGKNREIQFGEPLCNEQGVASVVRIVRAMVQQVNILSNYEEDDVRKLTKYLAMTLLKDLTFNRIKYDIKNDTARSQISLIAVSSGFAAGMRALDNGERQMLKKGVTETKLVTSSEGSSNKKGFWQKALGGK